MSKAADDVCVDCKNAKEEAQTKATATVAGKDGLNLGECAPLYRAWAECVEEHAGQSRACAAVLADFRLCHRGAAARALDDVSSAKGSKR